MAMGIALLAQRNFLWKWWWGKWQWGLYYWDRAIFYGKGDGENGNGDNIV